MTNYIKLLILTIVLITGLSACKAKSQADTDQVYSVESDSAQTVGSDGWLTDYQQALKTAQESNKTILVNFTGSDWCIWCKRLSKEVFTQKPFIDYAKANFVLLKLDFPKNSKQTDVEKKQNDTLQKQFNIEGFPTVVLLDKTGKEIGRGGYQEGGPEKYIEYLKTLKK